MACLFQCFWRLKWFFCGVFVDNINVELNGSFLKPLIFFCNVSFYGDGFYVFLLSKALSLISEIL